jgi:hypothetical protein
MPICDGCGRDFSLSGYTSHLRHTQNPHCAAIYQDALNDIPASDPVEPEEFLPDLGDWDPKLDNRQQDVGEDDAIAAGVIPADGTTSLL